MGVRTANKYKYHDSQMVLSCLSELFKTARTYTCSPHRNANKHTQINKVLSGEREWERRKKYLKNIHLIWDFHTASAKNSCHKKEPIKN